MRELSTPRIREYDSAQSGQFIYMAIPLIMRLSPNTTLGSYTILAPLGAGGMGEVWRARDSKLDRDVAIKVLPESLAREKERVRRFTGLVRGRPAKGSVHQDGGSPSAVAAVWSSNRCRRR